MVNPEIEEAVKSSSSLPVLRQMFINLSATKEGVREREGEKEGNRKGKECRVSINGEQESACTPFGYGLPINVCHNQLHKSFNAQL